MWISMKMKTKIKKFPPPSVGSPPFRGLVGITTNNHNSMEFTYPQADSPGDIFNELLRRDAQAHLAARVAIARILATCPTSSLKFKGRLMLLSRPGVIVFHLDKPRTERGDVQVRIGFGSVGEVIGLSTLTTPDLMKILEFLLTGWWTDRDDNIVSVRDIPAISALEPGAGRYQISIA